MRQRIAPKYNRKANFLDASAVLLVLILVGLVGMVVLTARGW